MREKDILSEPARVLTQEEEKHSLRGYVVKIISDDWLQKLNNALEKLIEKSKTLEKSDGIYDLELGHLKIQDSDG